MDLHSSSSFQCLPYLKPRSRTAGFAYWDTRTAFCLHFAADVDFKKEFHYSSHLHVERNAFVCTVLFFKNRSVFCISIFLFADDFFSLFFDDCAVDRFVGVLYVPAPWKRFVLIQSVRLIPWIIPYLFTKTIKVCEIEPGSHDDSSPPWTLKNRTCPSACLFHWIRVI